MNLNGIKRKSNASSNEVLFCFIVRHIVCYLLVFFIAYYVQNSVKNNVQQVRQILYASQQEAKQKACI